MLPAVKPDIKDDNNFELIRKKFGVKEDAFTQGVVFAQYVVDGVSRKKAYEQTFNVNSDVAVSNSSSYFRRKWVQELIRYLRPDDDTLYIGETKEIIRRGMEIVRDRRSSAREVTEAMKALQPYIKQEQIKMQLSLDDDVTETVSMISNLMSGIEQITKQDKMIGSSGEIIDVKLIE